MSGLLQRRSAGLTIGSDGNRLMPPTSAFSVFLGQLRTGRKHIQRRSGPQPQPRSPRHTIGRRTFFTCSPDECEVMPGIDGGGFLLHRLEAFRLSSLRLVFFCLFRIWGI